MYYICHEYSHLAKDCYKRKSNHSQLSKCYNCGKFTDHKAADCSITKEKQAKDRAMKSLEKNKRKNGAVHMVKSDGLMSVPSEKDDQSGKYLIIDSTWCH